MPPLVSVIMPTRSRREWSAEALDCFLNQTYPFRELLVLDDEDDPSFPDGLPKSAVLTYMRRPRWNVPKKRNALIEAARGELICQFDSDDWSHPERIQRQVEILQESGKQVTGFYTLWFIDEKSEAYQYVGMKLYACGSSLMYSKIFATRNPFPEHVRIASDNHFVAKAHREKQLVTVDVGELLVMRAHAGNTSKKQLQARSNFVPHAYTDLPELFRKAHAA